MKPISLVYFSNKNEDFSSRMWVLFRHYKTCAFLIFFYTLKKSSDILTLILAACGPEEPFYFEQK
jgi:hypothetical protein